MGEWRTVELGHLCARVTSGGTPERSRLDYYTGDLLGHPWVKSSELRDGYVRETDERISDLGLKESAAKLLPPETVLVAMYGATAGRVGFLKIGAAVNQAVCALVPDRGSADPGFLFHVLRSRYSELAGKSAGAAQQNLNAKIIKSFPLLAPNIATQRRITAVLSAFDELIEINERRIALLEDLARSLYREWFVHFRSPGHEEVEFVDSELGLIPDGWEVRAVREIARPHRRGVKPALEAEAEFEHFSIPAFDRSRLPEFERGGTIRSGKQAIDGECVLLSKINPRIERVWFAVPTTRRGVASTEFLVWAGVEASNAWLWAMFSGDTFQRWLLGVSGGTSTSHQRVKPQDVEAHVLPFAPPELREAFDRLATPALRQVGALRQRNRTLAASRDLLLPRLVTGRLDISDVDLGDLLPADAA